MLTEELNRLFVNTSTIFNINDLKIISGKLLMIILILIAMQLIIWLGSKLINRAFLSPGISGRVSFDAGRAKTLKSILISIMRYTVYFLAAITILDELNVPITAVLSAAGILGLAVGFGAQNLVRDVITGFFILLENQFSIGEYIETDGGIGGIVEELGLRVTKLRDWGGQLHIIPNGKITMVTNHNRGSMRALVEVEAAYEENVDRVIGVLTRIADSMAKDFADIITEGPKVLGIWSLGESGVLFRIVARTRPMEQWGIETELRRRIMVVFHEEGIEIPYPHRQCIVSHAEDAVAEK